MTTTDQRSEALRLHHAVVNAASDFVSRPTRERQRVMLEAEQVFYDALRRLAEENGRLKAQAVPEGWKLVPVAPTEAMHTAAVRAIFKCTGNDDFPPHVYRAMLNAAPQPAAPTQVETQGWQPIETAPKDGTVFRAYAEYLVDLDFNPEGSVECAWNGEEFIGCVWNGQQDAWYGKPINPTHWMPLPAAPSQGEKP